MKVVEASSLVVTPLIKSGGVAQPVDLKKATEPPPADPFAFRDEAGYPYDLGGYLSRLSVLAYRPGTEALKLAKAVEGRSHVCFFERADTEAIGFVERGHRILAFRGSASGQDWLTDFKFWPTGAPARHRGFDTAWRAVENDVREWLADTNGTGGPLLLTGHSLGGALATLAGLELSRTFPVRAIVTFGAPRVGGKAFRDAFQTQRSDPGRSDSSTLNQICWRVVHSTDIVPSLPPPLWYRHVGNDIYVTRKGYFHNGTVGYTAGLASITPSVTFTPGSSGALERLQKRIAYFVPFSSAQPSWFPPGLQLALINGLGWIPAIFACVVRMFVSDGMAHMTDHYAANLPPRTNNPYSRYLPKP